MHSNGAISNSRCKKRGFISERDRKWRRVLAAAGLPHRLGRLQEEDEEIAPNKRIQISCKAEMFRLRRALAEIRSAAHSVVLKSIKHTCPAVKTCIHSLVVQTSRKLTERPEI